MAIKIGANFAYNGKLPNFERDSFETKAAMKAFDENSIDEGHLSYCKEDGNIYQYKSTNAVDTTTGRWRIFKPDIVVDAALNGTSTNAIQNKAVFNALKLKADAAALDGYQLKYNADYIAKQDLVELPIIEGVIDLNGYQLNMTSVDSQGTDLTIINGTISFSAGATIKVSTLTFNNINITGNVGEDKGIKINADSVEFINVFSPVGDAFNTYLQDDTNLIQQLKIYNSNIVGCINAKEVFVYQSYISLINNSTDNPTIKLHAYNSYVLDDGYGLDEGSEWYNSQIELFEYPNGYIDADGEHRYNPFDDILENNSDNAPQTKAVYDALQLKADKTQLNDLATKTELSKYVTYAYAMANYAEKSDITGVYKFKGTKTNYSDLPIHTGIDRFTGDVWNITNANAEYGIKAGDNVAWNGTAWDNLSGTVDLSAYATTTTTDAMSADIKKLMDKAFPFTVKVSIDKTLAKKGTSQPVKVTITPKIGDDNTNADEIMINGAEHHGTTPYVYSDTATTTTTYNVRVSKENRLAHGSATITFVNPSYDGAVAANFTATEANIKSLTEAIRSGKGGTRTFNLNNQKACIAYPKAFGAATSIKDANGFDYLASYTRSELNVNGELYYVYLLTNAVVITDMKQTIS